MLNKQIQSFESFLGAEFNRKKIQNPQYSLRNFSRVLGTDVSQLSKIIGGKRRVSETRIEVLGQKLGLQKEIIEDFKRVSRLKRKLKNIEIFGAHGEKAIVQESQSLSPRAFLMCELLKILNEANQKLENILGCSSEEVESMKRQLLAEGFLTSRENAGVDPTYNSVELSFLETPIKNQYREAMQRSLQSVFQKNILLSVATSRERAAECEVKIRDFIDELKIFLADSPAKDMVYLFSLSLNGLKP